ncbi:MAG: hypothetical protein ACOY5B_18895 [Spirochaetota bacterium]
MISKFIRFVTDKDHLMDDIENGFRLREHKITFRSSLSTILPSLIEFWENSKISSREIDEIKQMFRTLNESDFWQWLADKMQQDIDFNLHLSLFTTQMRDARIKMKCFTELRDNQKLHPHHRDYFGSYGIALKRDWLLRNHGDRIIYVDKNLEVTNRIARLTSMLSSSGLSTKDTMKAMFDVLSFTEIEDHSHEFEWRIVGNHHFAGQSYGNYPDIIPFSCEDVLCVFTPNANEVTEFDAKLRAKAAAEGISQIPEVRLTDSIFLTSQEVVEIENIFGRR